MKSYWGMCLGAREYDRVYVAKKHDGLDYWCQFRSKNKSKQVIISVKNEGLWNESLACCEVHELYTMSLYSFEGTFFEEGLLLYCFFSLLWRHFSIIASQRYWRTHFIFLFSDHFFSGVKIVFSDFEFANIKKLYCNSFEKHILILSKVYVKWLKWNSCETFFVLFSLFVNRGRSVVIENNFFSSNEC